MDIIKRNVRKDNCSCSFCDKGFLSKRGVGLDYPYDSVIEFRNWKNGPTVRFCDACLKELVQGSLKIKKGEK